MSSEIFINYWIGQEPNPPSPTLDQMPAYVDIVPLAFVMINSSYELDFGFLTQHFTAETIQGWVKTVQANGTKVLFSILDKKLGSIPADKQQHFVDNVVANAAEWGVDGLDFDFEPPYDSPTLIPLIDALRAALPSGSVFTAPVYGAWRGFPICSRSWEAWSIMCRRWITRPIPASTARSAIANSTPVTSAGRGS
ncbi:MAG: glycosyl hydrolase family 18 protein [Sphingomonas sp.]